MKRHIKVPLAKSKQVNELLDALEGRRRKNLLCCAEIVERAAMAEHQMEALKIPKKYRCGAEVVYGGGPGAYAKSYSYPIATTVVRIRRRTKDWTLAEAWTQDLYPQAPQPDQLILTPQQDEIAVSHFRRRYMIKSAAQD